MAFTQKKVKKIGKKPTRLSKKEMQVKSLVKKVIS